MTTANNGDLTSKIAIKHDAGVLFGELVWIDNCQLMFSIDSEIQAGTVAELRLNLAGLDENLYMLIQIDNIEQNGDSLEHTARLVHCHEYDLQAVDKWVSDVFPSRADEWIKVDSIDYEEATCSKKAFLNMISRLEKRRAKKQVVPLHDRSLKIPSKEDTTNENRGLVQPTTQTVVQPNNESDGLRLTYPGSPKQDDSSEKQKPYVSGSNQEEIARAKAARKLAAMITEATGDPVSQSNQPEETKVALSVDTTQTSEKQLDTLKSVENVLPTTPHAQDFDDEAVVTGKNKYLAAMMRRGSLRGGHDTTQRLLKKKAQQLKESTGSDNVGVDVTAKSIQQDSETETRTATSATQMPEPQVSLKPTSPERHVTPPTPVTEKAMVSQTVPEQVQPDELQGEDSTFFNLSPYGNTDAVAALHSSEEPTETSEEAPLPQTSSPPLPPEKPTQVIEDSERIVRTETPNETDFQESQQPSATPSAPREEESNNDFLTFGDGTYTLQWPSVDTYISDLPGILAGTLVLPAQELEIRRLVLKLPDGQKLSIQISPTDLGDGTVDLKPRVATMVKLKLKRAAKE
jgi:hypothetical protein